MSTHWEHPLLKGILTKVILSIEGLDNMSGEETVFSLFILQQVIRMDKHHEQIELLVSKCHTVLSNLLLQVVSANGSIQQGMLIFCNEMINYLLQKGKSIGRVEKKSVQRILDYQEALEAKSGINWQSRMITECLMLVSKVQDKCDIGKRCMAFSETLDTARLFPLDPGLLIQHIMQEYPAIKDK